VETNKERRQRTPAIVALVAEGFSAEPIRLVLDESDVFRSKRDAGTFREGDLM